MDAPPASTDRVSGWRATADSSLGPKAGPGLARLGAAGRRGGRHAHLALRWYRPVWDRVLAGGVDAGGYTVEHRPVADPQAILDWFAQAAGDVPRKPAPRGTTWTIRELVEDEEPRLRPIQGGSDAPAGVSAGCTTSAPPHEIRTLRGAG